MYFTVHTHHNIFILIGKATALSTKMSITGKTKQNKKTRHKTRVSEYAIHSHAKVHLF